MNKWMIEEFIYHVLETLRGTADVARPEAARRHGDHDKWKGFYADLDNVHLMSGIIAIAGSTYYLLLTTYYLLLTTYHLLLTTYYRLGRDPLV